ncbi:MAG: helix-turn-helix domain-containing protein [Candidatus Cryptobacteroides sp.]|nr:helix-turn-helix domain-containing protein [Candidatus Cryptobacteroides sp.]
MEQKSTITYTDFCNLNGIDPGENMHCLEEARFPEGDFSGNFTVVIYSSKGICPISIDGRQFTIRRKCISVWRPGQVINFSPVPELKYRLLLISGELKQYLNVGNQFLTLFVTEEYPVIRVTSAYDDALRLFFDSISIVARFNDNPYKRDCELSILRALFFSTSYYVFQSLRFKNGNILKFASEFPGSGNEVVIRFIRLIEIHSTTCRHLAFYAKELDYNPKYLSALVKRQTGYSGQALIDQYSVLTAMAKLSYGHRSIKEISDEMNFQSQSDFGKFFKRMTGVSPINYRKDRFKGL